MKTILLIEDNVEILDNLKEYLELAGYRIISATNGEEGLEIALQHIPDLIVCDVLMPGIDGYEVLRRLKQKPASANIPFIFSSSLSEKVDKFQAIALGANDYFVKPFEPEMIIRAIEKLAEKVV